MAIMTLYHKSTLSGGATDALDGINGNLLMDGDRAYIIMSGVFYVYYLDADSGATDNGTTIIAPDTNAGTKRWLRCTMTPP